MKLAIQGVVAALGILAVSQAHATIATGNTGELFLSVFDPVSEKSYLRDLGVTLPNFSPTGNSRPTNGASFGFGAAPTYETGSVLAGGYGFSFQQDALLTSFLGTSSSHPEALLWNIGAFDTSSLNQDPTKILTTTNATAAQIAGMTNSSYNSAINPGGPPSFISTSNALAGQIGGTTPPTAFNGSNTAVAANGLAYFPSIYGSNLGTFASFNTTAKLGESLSSYIISNSGGDLTNSVAARPFSNAEWEGLWTLNSEGVLSYQVVAVPEPGTYALLGAGLIMLCAIARRRLS